MTDNCRSAPPIRSNISLNSFEQSFPSQERNIASASPTPTVTYTPTSQLTACLNPQREMTMVLKNIQSKQWDERFNALNTVRKLAIFHKDILEEHLVTLARFVGTEINSLRSSVSRIAIICAADLFATFGKKMDICIDAMVICLLLIFL